MPKGTTYENHPAADLFPMMSEPELEALADDIREHGQQEPIKLCDGKVLDGRNRLLACQQAGVEPTFEDVNGLDPLMAVISANVKRRKMLTVGQRAIAAAESWPLAGGRRKKGERKSTAAVDLTEAEMAKRWEIGTTALSNATALVERDPDAAAAVKHGSKTLQDAFAELRERERALENEQAALARLRKGHPELAERVDREQVTLDEAKTLAMEQDREDEAARRRLRDGLHASLDDLAWEEGPGRMTEAERAVWLAERVAGDDRITVDRLRSAAAIAAGVADILETEAGRE